MRDRQVKLTECVKASIDEFNTNEQYLVRHDLGERCICAKFAVYLERQIRRSGFGDYAVDVEYNRGGMDREYDPKRLGNRNIVVDLIVHKRGFSRNTEFNNLICIEMKKGYKRLDFSADKARLRALIDKKNGFGYLAGFMIEVFACRREDAYGLRIGEKFYAD